MPPVMKPFCRRDFLTVAAGLSAGFVRSQERPGAGAEIPVTGVARPGLESFDRMMTAFLAKHTVPGASLCVSRNARLVYSRGFGFADTDNKEAVEPDALFRIASISKPFTAVTVLRLLEKGKLRLSDKILDHLTIQPLLPVGAQMDPRWKEITIAHCLRHTGGWDRDQSFDPIGRVGEIAKTLGTTLPASPEQIVRYMMARQLDFDPGSRAAYSNLGYLILGRIIEKVAGPYEETVGREVLKPLGITSMKLGKARLEMRTKGEVRYYPNKPWTGPAVVGPKIGEIVPGQYGAQNLEGFEAHGGWIASAPDLVKFADAFNHPKKSPLLKEETIGVMHGRPEGLAGFDAKGKPKPAYLGCGWMIRPVGEAGKLNAFHTGQISGTSTLLVRRHDGLNWAVLFNSDVNADRKPLASLIDPLVHQAAEEVKKWPE